MARQPEIESLGTAMLSLTEKLCVEARSSRKIATAPTWPAAEPAWPKTGGFRAIVEAKIVAKIGAVAPEREFLLVNY